MNLSSFFRPMGLPVVVAVLLALNVLPELVLQASDHGLIGPAPGVLRGMAYLFGAFHPDLVSQRGELYPLHTLGMFFSYAFLHTGLVHLAINMTGLVWLGRMVLERRQTETFLLLYALSAIGAAEAFVLIGPAGGMMVGASGALFGLLGAYLVDSGLLMPRQGLNAPMQARIARVVVLTIAVVLSDVASRWILGTPVAWQAHAGGFLTGAFMAMAAPARRVFTG
jgi:membrane associated rhomboid family serine protease